MEDSKLMTTQEAARALGISDAYLRSLVRSGKAQPTRQVGGTWLFSLGEVERLRNRKRTKGPGKKHDD